MFGIRHCNLDVHVSAAGAQHVVRTCQRRASLYRHGVTAHHTCVSWHGTSWSHGTPCPQFGLLCNGLTLRMRIDEASSGKPEPIAWGLASLKNVSGLVSGNGALNSQVRIGVGLTCSGAAGKLAQRHLPTVPKLGSDSYMHGCSS